MKNFLTSFRLLLPGLLLIAACGQDSVDSTPVSEEPQAEPETPSLTGRTPSADSAQVFFITPSDGDIVASPVQIDFGLDGMELVPAGTHRPNSGHHHIIIDHALPDMNLPVPKDAQRVHFGDGRSKTELELAPGPHTLQLLLADHLHIPHDPPLYSEQISITVE